jgi:hypothetical protein
MVFDGVRMGYTRITYNNKKNNNKISYNRNAVHVERKNKGDSSNNKRDWDHYKVIQKIREQNTKKPRS